jgi:RNA polymerase sigma-70 factor (ECF subfamily)
VSKSHVNDDALVARAREGDQEAFGELVRRHQAAVQRAALAASESAADADDIAQDAFVLAFRRLKTFRGEASFKTWVLTITWNQAMNHRRKTTRWFRRFTSVESEDGSRFKTMEFASTAGTPEDLLAHGQLRDDIRDAIRALPEKLRDALLLAASGEYSYDEIGAMTKTKTGTIKWRVSEARRLVREKIDRSL